MALTTWELSNDTRGWIMTLVSGAACIFGAGIICVDSLVRLFPGRRGFRIEQSSVFQACSLSLSFGVMLFTSLYSMLPESKGYLKDDGWSDRSAGLVMMACFVAGFFGIQALSRLLHQYIPSHVVDCNHSHVDSAGPGHAAHPHDRPASRPSRPRHRLPRSQEPDSAKGNGCGSSESTPLLRGKLHDPPAVAYSATISQNRSVSPSHTNMMESSTDLGRRPSIVEVQKRVMSFVKDTKSNCDVQGSCYGFSDPCGQECFKHIRTHGGARQATVLRTADNDPNEDVGTHFSTSRATSREPLENDSITQQADDDDDDDESPAYPAKADDDPEAQQHHHHVPKNAFLSIGLQTSIAIALHKFPEGFITYATNHANPTLGFNVFMALFIHNISEGFAMALPLYMALGSRWRAMLWSCLLGGLSQPLGAGVAVLWFRIASHNHLSAQPAAYACLFAATAGIMVSVALQLFVESLSLNHDRNMSIFFAFIGMALLGLSNALFGGH